MWFNPWVRKIPWGRKWQSTPVFLPRKSHGQRSLVDYIPKGGKELNMTEVTMNKVSEGDGIPVELLQILKHDAVKVLHSIYQQIWKTQQWPQDWKMSVFIPVPKKGNAKECSNYCTIALILHASKVMLKIL